MYTLILGRTYPAEETGMMGIFEFEQAVALNKYGMPTVYAFCDTRSIKVLRKLNYKEFTTQNVPVYGYHFPIGGMPRGIFDKLKTNKYKRLLKKIINNHGMPSIIHIHFPLITIHDSIWEYLKQLNVPIVCTEHWSKVQNKQIEKYRVHLLKKIVKEANKYYCVSEELKSSVIDLTQTNKTISIMPNMVKSEFNFTENDSNKLEFRFITIGRLVENKRVGSLINTFYNKFSKDNNVILDIVGSGNLYEDIKQQIKNLKMEDRILLHGFKSRIDTAKLLKNSDVYVSASLTETFGVPFIEAMACGKPVIGADTIPLSEFINTHEFGKLFKVDEQQSLGNCMRYIYNNYSIYNGQEISRRTLLVYNEENVINNVLSDYQSLVRINKGVIGTNES